MKISFVLRWVIAFVLLTGLWLAGFLCVMTTEWAAERYEKYAGGAWTWLASLVRDLVYHARAVVAAGIAAILVSCGMGGWLEHRGAKVSSTGALSVGATIILIFVFLSLAFLVTTWQDSTDRPMSVPEPASSIESNATQDSVPLMTLTVPGTRLRQPRSAVS